jgi:hypothetical protein
MPQKRVLGADVVKRRMKLITRNVRREVGVRLDQSAKDLLLRARGLSPQLEGFLIGAGDILKRGNRNVVKRIVFFDSPYAVIRHEDVYNLGPISSLKKSPDGPIGRKFLSRPFQAQGPRYIREIGEGVNLALRQSVR